VFENRILNGSEFENIIAQYANVERNINKKSNKKKGKKK